MVIGGIAVVARGVRRMTADIDAVVEGDTITLPRLFDVLGDGGIVPRIDAARAFAEANLVLLLRQVDTGVDLDNSLACTSFEVEAFRAHLRRG
jgi:hypothetical protein